MLDRFQTFPEVPGTWWWDTPVRGRPLGRASGALAPAADFEGAPKRQSPTGHTLIRSTVAWWFPHLQTERVAKDFFFLIWLYWLQLILMCFGVYICIFTLCLMFIAANIVCCRLRHQDARCTHRSINSLLSQYCKASLFFFFKFLCTRGGGGVWGVEPTVCFAPVVPWTNTGPAPVPHLAYGTNPEHIYIVLKYSDLILYIFVNCNWVDTRW
jgi:hypothetical protein